MKNNIIEVNIKAITEREGFNTRYDLGDLREIVSNMERTGFDPSQPLIVAEDGDGKYLLGSQGHRRFQAAQQAQLKTVFVVLEDKELTDSDRNLDIVRLNSGEPLPILAVARVIERHMAENVDTSKAEMAKLLAKSPTFIGDCVKLTSTTKKTQKWIEADRISASEVILIINELEAKDEKGFAKVEKKIEKMLAKAKSKGKESASASDKDEEGEIEETDEERQEREAQEKEDAEADAAAKAENKARHEVAKRAIKFADFVDKASEGVAEAEKNKETLNPFEVALFNLEISLASYLTGKPYLPNGKVADKGDSDKLSDVGTSVRALTKVYVDGIKTAQLQAKEEIKEVTKASKEKAAKVVAAAKEAAKA